MTKYEPLALMLSQANGDEIDVSFAELEKILGFALPHSARKYRPWWSNGINSGHSQTLGWVPVGWETRDVDMTRERVRFVRKSAGAGSQRHLNADIWAQARAFTGISDRAELEAAAARALIQQTAARQLAMLGGTMPDAHAGPRERPGK